MDLRMPRMEGAEATRRILASLPETRVLVLTTYADDEFLFPALQAGARGYLTKDATAEEIEQAIRAFVAGRTHLDPAVQQRLVAAVLDQTQPPAATGGERRRPRELPDELTPREVEVLKLIAAGLSNREIADAARPERRHRQNPREPDLLQDRRARPRPGRAVRVPARPGVTAVSSYLTEFAGQRHSEYAAPERRERSGRVRSRQLRSSNHEHLVALS